jgi:uncharacterized protein (TIGR04255 family)
MPFPEVKRVIYERNPLRQVICQLRFPPILRIDAELPAAFQDAIRDCFPNFAETSEWQVEVPEGVREAVSQEAFSKIVQTSGVKNYELSSDDKQWKVNLTRTFIALTARKYHRWEEFKGMLSAPLTAFAQTYCPACFTRLGLRYVNVIKRSDLGLAGVPWSELLQPSILGVLGSSDVGDQVQASENQYEIRLSDGEGTVRLVTRLALAGDETIYMIDSDFFTVDKTKVEDVLSRLDFFNTRASRLIQWCITSRLHQAMEPHTI